MHMKRESSMKISSSLLPSLPPPFSLSPGAGPASWPGSAQRPAKGGREGGRKERERSERPNATIMIRNVCAVDRQCPRSLPPSRPPSFFLYLGLASGAFRHGVEENEHLVDPVEGRDKGGIGVYAGGREGGREGGRAAES